MPPKALLAVIAAQMPISLRGTDFLTPASVGGASALGIFRRSRAQPASPPGKTSKSSKFEVSKCQWALPFRNGAPQRYGRA